MSYKKKGRWGFAGRDESEDETGDIHRGERMLNESPVLRGVEPEAPKPSMNTSSPSYSYSHLILRLILRLFHRPHLDLHPPLATPAAAAARFVSVLLHNTRCGAVTRMKDEVPRCLITSLLPYQPLALIVKPERFTNHLSLPLTVSLLSSLSLLERYGSLSDIQRGDAKRARTTRNQPLWLS